MHFGTSGVKSKDLLNDPSLVLQSGQAVIYLGQFQQHFRVIFFDENPQFHRFPGGLRPALTDLRGKQLFDVVEAVVVQKHTDEHGNERR